MDEIAMTKYEIAALFGIIAPTVKPYIGVVQYEKRMRNGICVRRTEI